MNSLSRSIFLGAALAALSVPAAAQAADPARNDATVVNERNDSDFPWGLLGLIGLAGLMGRKRNDVTLRDDRTPNDAIRR